MNNLMIVLPLGNPKYLASLALSLSLSASLSALVSVQPALAQGKANAVLASAAAVPPNTTPARSSAIPAPINNPAPQSNQSSQPASGSLQNPVSNLSKDISNLDNNSDMPALRPMQLPGLSPAGTSPAAGPIVSGTIQFSEQPKTMGSGMTILQSLDEALVKSPRAAAIRAQLQITTAAYAEAAAGPNPAFLFDRAPLGEQVRRVGPTFTIEGPWKLVFRLLATKRLVEQTKTDLMTAIWALRADVRRAYTEVVVAQETVETLNSLYDLASRLLEVSDKRFQAGDVPELDVLKARLATSQSDVERQVGMRRVIRAKQQLNVIMGRKPEDIVNIPRLPAFLGIGNVTKLEKSQKGQLLPDFAIEPAPLATYIQKALDQRLELKSVEQRIKLNKAQMRTAISNVVPNPSVSFGNSVSGNAPSGPKVSSVFFTVVAESPITNWNQGEIYRLKATSTQLKYELGAQKNIVTAQVSSAYNNVLAARQKLKVYQEHILADSYEVARLARRSYEVGQSDITATLQVQQANVAVRSQYLDAVRAYQEAYTDLEQSCGRPLDN